MAIVDNILGFSLKRTINNIIINNLLEDDTTIVITATLFLQQNCSNTSFTQTSSEMIIEDVLSIQMPILDGTYKLRLTFTKNTGEFIYKEFLFTTYKNLLESFIEDTKDILCDLNCNNCEEETKSFKEHRLVLNMMSYYILNKEYYSKIFNIGLDCIKCTILDNLNCNRVNNSFYGKKENEVVYKKMIGYFYLVFYFGQKYTYTCCPEEIDRFFKSDLILKCLSNINLDVDCVELKIISDDTFSISDDNFVDLTPDASFEN